MFSFLPLKYSYSLVDVEEEKTTKPRPQGIWELHTLRLYLLSLFVICLLLLAGFGGFLIGKAFTVGDKGEIGCKSS